MTDKRGFHLEANGLFYYRAPKTEDEATETVWLCAPLEVAGLAVDEDDRWGKLLKWLDPNGQEVTWVMPTKLLSRKDDIWGELLDRGLAVTADPRARLLLHTFLNESQPERRIHCTRRLGWIERTDVSYILPNQIIGSQTDVFFTGNAKAYTVKGTVQEWQEHVGRLCRGNSRLVLAVSMAFAAPLLYLISEPSGGFHLHGLSQTGKTKALTVLSSATGAELRTWRTTDNALESVCEERCDSVLVLDEMGQVAPEKAGDIAYMVANGEGKGRALQTGESARRVKRWRVLMLSSGEITLADKMREAGARRRGGQEIRLVDVPADAGAGMGVFENIHGAKGPGEFAEQLGRAAQTYRGAPFFAYMEKLVKLVVEYPALPAVLAEERDQFIRDHLPEGASGQVRSVCGRFAVVATAGELATDMGITGWDHGEATAAALKCFQAWIGRRSTVGDHDIEQGIEQVRAFIEKHAASRFETIYTGQGEFVTTIYNRVGYRKHVVEHADAEHTDHDWHYYVLPEQWKEITKGYDAQAIAQAMAMRGLIMRHDGRRLTSKVQTPHDGRPRVYHVTPRLFECDE